MRTDRDTSIEAVIHTAGGWLRMHHPVDVIEAWSPDAVTSVLARTEQLAVGSGLHAVGFVTYEAGAAFGLPTCPPLPDVPLIWFALFPPERVDRLSSPPSGGGYDLDGVRPTIDQRRFNDAFGRVKDCIAAGETYQVNFTFRVEARFRGEPAALFAHLAAAQQGQYAAYLNLGSHAICSASPELFFSRAGGTLECRPMKGTARRGRFPEEDRTAAAALRGSEKQRAENVMIVDMVRNDLGRVAAVGTVHVPELFRVEKYPNVWQLTSSVTAKTTASLSDIFAALHPSASVTGAPKIRTAAIIAALEGRARGVYTGAVGHIAPGGDACFNVAIRTAVIDRTRGRLEFGIGSGIVWDSEAAAEFEECLLKGTVLGRRPVNFELLETLRWTPGEGFFLLDRHLARLQHSAEYFDFPCPLDAVRQALDGAVAAAAAPRRVRLLLSRDGVQVEHAPLDGSAAHLRVELAASPIDASDVFLFHKTTNRRVYERAQMTGHDEVILWNARREITEATTANVVVERHGRRVTPPIHCGLLGGTFRAELLARGEVSEAIVTVDELLAAPRVWLINSVREWQQAVVARERGALA